MSDKLDQKLDALLAAARASEPDTTRLEYAFETRVAARLRAEASASIFSWAWRLCPFFAALAIAAAWWTQRADRLDAVSPLAAENASAQEEQMLVAYMTGDR